MITQFSSQNITKQRATFIVEKYLITFDVIAFQCVINDNYGGCRSKSYTQTQAWTISHD